MIILTVTGLHASPSLMAQLTVAGQLRTRTEFRNGQGSPLPENAKPAFFTSQRSRLSVGYSGYRLKLGLTGQDVRVWGQDLSTINRFTTTDNNGLMLHEAWGEIFLTDTTVKNKTVSIKLGRQELVYDDSRLIGNLDWLQQARRHDAALFKFENNHWMLHLAAAFNQNKENNSGTIYNAQSPGYAANTNNGPMYKSMQFFYAGRKLKKGSLSFLFFTDQFSRFHNDTVNQVAIKTFENKSWNRITSGFYFNNTFSKLAFTASAYYQTGYLDSYRKVSAFLLSGFLNYSLCSATQTGAGVDYTSGGGNSTLNKSFDPLYGTPHKFWGLMDYFYAASPFGRTGLVDYYLKTKWKASERLTLNADLHHFTSASQVALAADPYNNKRNFGEEVDIVASWQLTMQISFEGGYAQFFAKPLLTSPAVKNISNPNLNSNWAYVMINIRPEFLSR
jgi:hypothetical protein